MMPWSFVQVNFNAIATPSMSVHTGILRAMIALGRYLLLEPCVTILIPEE